MTIVIIRLQIKVVACHSDHSSYSNNHLSKVWIKVGLDKAYIPVLLSLNSKNKTLDCETNQVIFYEQPNPKRLQFLALSPLELDISSTEMNIPSKPSSKKLSVEETTAKNMAKILDFGHLLNGELTPVSDDLDIVLVQVRLICYACSLSEIKQLF